MRKSARLDPTSQGPQDYHSSGWINGLIRTMMAMIAMMMKNERYSSSTNCMDIRNPGPTEHVLKSCD